MQVSILKLVLSLRGKCSSTCQAFPAGFAAQQSVKQLQAQTVWRRKASVAKCSSSGDHEADAELWRQEVEGGWLNGPNYLDGEVSNLLGTSDWICAR